MKEFLYTLEQRVGSLVATEQAWAGEISEPVKDLLASLDVVTAILKKGLYFFLLKVCHSVWCVCVCVCVVCVCVCVCACSLWFVYDYVLMSYAYIYIII